jgi:hypothetical protein
MSQHTFSSKDAHGTVVTVTLGYDRPLDYVFCTVEAENGDIIYSNLDDDEAGTEQQNVDYYEAVLRDLGIQVPESMFREVNSDQAARVGNRVVVHRTEA